MDSVANKTLLAANKINKIENVKEALTIIIINYKKQKRQQKYKKKQYESNERRFLIGKPNKSNKEIKQNERR